MKERIEIVDLAKGVAILLVIFGHALTSVIDSLHITASTGNASVWYAMKMIYAFHMPLFFFIGGFFASHMLRCDVRTFFGKKVSRLVIPYFAWCFIQGLAGQLMSRYTTHGYGLKEFLMSPVVPFMEYWFLYVLFFIHVIYYFLVRHVKRGNEVFIGLSAVAFLFYGMMPQVWIVPRLSEFMIYFALGTIALPLVKRINMTASRGGGILLLFVIINALYVYGLMNGVQGFLASNVFGRLASFAVTAIDSWTVFCLCDLLVRANARGVRHFLDFCGAKSMELYCSHVYFLVAMRIGILKLTGTGFLWVKILFIGVVTTAICYVVFRRFTRGSRLYKVLFGI